MLTRGRLTQSFSGSDDEKHEKFQARLPEMTKPTYENTTEEAMWIPVNSNLDNLVDVYLNIALNNFNFTEEQALALLKWHNMNFQSATADLSNYEPVKEVWSFEEKQNFTAAIIMKQKQFGEIKKLFPNKTVKQLIQSYYLMKHNSEELFNSHIQLNKWRLLHLNNMVDYDNNQEDTTDPLLKELVQYLININILNDDSAYLSKAINDILYDKRRNIVSNKSSVESTKDDSTDSLSSCERTSSRRYNRKRLKKILHLCRAKPTKIYFNNEDFLDFLSSNFVEDVDIIDHSTKVSAPKMAEISIDFEKYDKCVKDIPQVSDKWSYTDVNLLVDGIQNHGNDLSVLADCILTKTPEMVSRFLEMNYYTLNVNFLESIYEKRMNSDNDQKEDGEKKSVEAALNDLYNTQVELVTSKRSVRTEKRQPSTCTYSHDNPNRSFSPTSALNFSPRIKIAKY